MLSSACRLYLLWLHSPFIRLTRKFTRSGTSVRHYGSTRRRWRPCDRLPLHRSQPSLGTHFSVCLHLWHPRFWATSFRGMGRPSPVLGWPPCLSVPPLPSSPCAKSTIAMA